ncbi:hypothetical protein [Sulfurimonas sp.]|uniref:hypothetical protein n=1 Tax=Sulfurimonas sp. TaxID=2022749 RepID=UPI003564308E
MKKRKAVVLFVTLMLMLLLLSIVSVFLNKTKESKDDVTSSFAMIQTNFIMHNLFKYLKTIKFNEETIHYTSMTPIPLNIGQSNLILKLNSAQRYININAFVNSAIKDNLINDKFILLLTKYKLKEPYFFLDLLKDTVDNDKESRNSKNSEIIKAYPIFRNSKIYNQTHLDKIIDFYFEKTGDATIYNVPFSEIFSFTNSTVDINFLSYESMKILFDDANQNTLKTIADYPDVYAKLEDLPFDQYYMKKINKGMLGHKISTTTNILSISIDINYKEQFKSKINFEYNAKTKKPSNYKIDIIKLEKAD